MADRYWVGGTATWDGTAGTKWATTSGGAGGASVPTVGDDVFFDANSSGTCVISAGTARSINCTGFTGTLAGSSGATLTVAGSITLSAGMGHTYVGTVTITGSSTIISAGKTLSGTLDINGAGITVGLGDALSVSTLQIQQGTFNTNNYNVTAVVLSAGGTNTRTINLGSSTITLSAFITITQITNLTFNAGTSQINLSSTSNPQILTIDGLTFHNVSFTGVGARTCNIFGPCTFNNLSLNGNATGLSTLAIDSNQTVNGTLTCSGNSATQRVFVRSTTLGGGGLGITRTITAAAISANDCDFRDITLAGAAAGASPTRAGDCGGNSGITFPAAKTVYRVGTNTTWAGSSSWATTSGGTGADTNFPLAQDTAVIDNNTALSGTLSLGVVYNISALDCSTRTNALTLAHDVSVSRYGSYILGSGITVTGNSFLGVQTFAGRGTMDVTSAGKTIAFPITLDSIGGTLRLQDALTMSITGFNNFTHNNGIVNLNGFNLTVGDSYVTGIGTKNITFNGGTLTCPNSGTAFNNAQPIGFTTTAGSGSGAISMTSGSAKTFAGGVVDTVYNCALNNGGAGALTITGNNTFTTLSNSVQPTTFSFTAGTRTIVTNWNISGTAGNLVTIQSATAASHTLTKVGGGIVSADYLSISRSTADGGPLWYAGVNSVDGGNNSGWVFAAAPAGVVSSGFLAFFLQ